MKHNCLMKSVSIIFMLLAMMFSCTSTTDDSENGNSGNDVIQSGNNNENNQGEGDNQPGNNQGENNNNQENNDENNTTQNGNNNQGNTGGGNENAGGTIEKPVVSDSIYGEWIDEETNLVYTINEDGTYSIVQNGILIEDGNFEEDNADSRAARKTVTITSIPKTSGGAKKSATVPQITTTTISKSLESENISVGNTSLTPKSSSSNSKAEKFYVYVQSDVVPEILYSNGDAWGKAKISAVAGATKIAGISYRWYKFVIENVDEIVFEDENIVFDSTQPYCIYDGYEKSWKFYDSKPDDIFSDEDYAGRDNLYYIRGNFEAGVDQYLATDGFNNMEEIEENIFKGTLYLPENVYGFKVSTDDWEYDYCVPFDASFVAKNEWFNVVRGEYTKWYGKNAALSTAGGMYTFILDITDSENPQMMISSDEEDYEISDEDSALYVLGTFNDWKYDSSNGMMAETSEGTYNGTINVTTTGLCEFKIADKAWGAIIDDIGFSWWNESSREIILDNPTLVDGAYTSNPKGSTENIVINFEETGSYNVNLVKGFGDYTLTVSKQ